MNQDIRKKTKKIFKEKKLCCSAAFSYINVIPARRMIAIDMESPLVTNCGSLHMISMYFTDHAAPHQYTWESIRVHL